ncbi:MAG: glycosyltransferase [Anaerolineae bacterium]
MQQAFAQVLGQTQPDLIHIQHLMGLPVGLVKRIRQAGLPFVITLHDYWWVCANAQLLTNYSGQLCAGPQAGFNCARCALARAGQPHAWPLAPPLAGVLTWRNYLLRRVLHAAGRLIAPTEFVRRWYAGHGAPAERLVLIPHGLDRPDLPPRPARRSSQPLRLVYIGGLTWQKGVHTLVKAFEGVGEWAELWIAGDETVDPAYVAMLKAQASPQVRFLGQLSRAEVWATLAQAGAVLVPSLWYETFSFIVSEAFAAGVPVLASRLGTLADRVSDGVDGLLVPPGDVSAWREAIHRLAQEPELLPRLQANVQPPRTLAAHAEEIERVYQAVLSRNESTDYTDTHR